ncbi:HAD-IC family P-type ATPase [Microbacterium sp. NPDC091313]
MRYFREQGVEVRVISGDDHRTAAALAARAGLDGAGSVDARTLSTDAEWDDALARAHVFGRVSPEAKRRAVQRLQHSGRTVAMIGDGVNDALAMKAADLGVAMRSGTEATRAAADLVLLDNRFDRLPAVVCEGRRVLVNMERVTGIFLVKTVYVLTIAVLLGALLLPFPLLPRQLSLTDDLTIGVPVLVLGLLPASERPRPGALQRAIRFAAPSGLVIAAATIAVVTVGHVLSATAPSIATASTVVMATAGIWVLRTASRPLPFVTAGLMAAMMTGLVLAVRVPAVVRSNFLFRVPVGHRCPRK